MPSIVGPLIDRVSDQSDREATHCNGNSDSGGQRVRLQAEGSRPKMGLVNP